MNRHSTIQTAWKWNHWHDWHYWDNDCTRKIVVLAKQVNKTISLRLNIMLNFLCDLNLKCVDSKIKIFHNHILQFVLFIPLINTRLNYSLHIHKYTNINHMILLIVLNKNKIIIWNKLAGNDCQVSDYDEWGECTGAVCGQMGKQYRQRYYKNADSATKCNRKLFETKICMMPQCTDDGINLKFIPFSSQKRFFLNPFSPVLHVPFTFCLIFSHNLLWMRFFLCLSAWLPVFPNHGSFLWHTGIRFAIHTIKCKNKKP